jgi:hypothetical protein
MSSCVVVEIHKCNAGPVRLKDTLVSPPTVKRMERPLVSTSVNLARRLAGWGIRGNVAVGYG